MVGCSCRAASGIVRADEASPAADAPKLPKDNRLCIVCHIDLEEEVIASAHEDVGIVCAACHGLSKDHMHDEMLMTKPDDLIGRKEVEPFCGECHDEHENPKAVEAFRKKWYGRDRPNGRVINEHSVCTDCHGLHNVVKTMGGRERQSQVKEEWKPLFNGENLTGWKPTEAGEWVVTRGRIVGAARGGTAGTIARPFALSAFRLAMTFRPVGPVSARITWSTARPSGGSQAPWTVQLTGSKTAAGSSPEPGALTAAGRLLCRNPSPEAFDAGGWNTLTLAREEGYVQVWLNGVALYRVWLKAAKPDTVTIAVDGEAESALEIREVNVLELPFEEH
jgi:hypothetical protein